MKRIEHGLLSLCLSFLLSLTISAQTYKYLGVDDGLSDRRIFCIQKDSIGYMWFLTNEGMDRYNGKEIRHYGLKEEASERTVSTVHAGWTSIDAEGNPWVADKQGRIFRYEPKYDHFRMVCKLPKSQNNISYCYMKQPGEVWLCNRYFIYRYETATGQTTQIPNVLKESITCIRRNEQGHYYVATEAGVYDVVVENDAMKVQPDQMLGKIQAQVSELFYHQPTGRLFIGTFEKGVFAYDVRQQRVIQANVDLSDVNITQICMLNPDELLIATEGMGIYKMDVHSCVAAPYIVADYSHYNRMNGNNINDLYVDEENRIWVSNYPGGITVVDNRYTNYNWIKHSVGNRQSLINDQVHAVMEDSDGDLWFGTSNGISLYQTATGQWHSFLSSEDKRQKNRNTIFITLCEVSPGVIWAGGYTSGIYKIYKKTLSVEYFTPSQYTSDNIRPDKYIRNIMKDSQGKIWSGGYYNLKCFDLERASVRLYAGISNITAIAEKDEDHIWIGTSMGLFLLEKASGQFSYINLQEEAVYINSLYQSAEGLLYIGTSGAGMSVYDARNHTCESYQTENSALVSNNIYAILPEQQGCIMVSTENGISCFVVKDKIFHNWTKEQGLMSSCFSASSGTLRRDGGFVFGSTDGAIEFPASTRLPKYTYSPMILSDLYISYQRAYPGDKNSPLKQDINLVRELNLSYNQKSFSFKVSTINYDAPDNVIFYWKLDGAYNQWNRLVEEGMLRFTNLTPGDYTLRLRAVSKEEPYLYFEERSLDIVVAPPFWRSGWAMLCYLILLVAIFAIGFRIISLNKQKKVSDEKTRFFINTAHDIRTPLTLIKAPLEDLMQNRTLDASISGHMNMALRNVNSLLQMTTNLINFERAEVYSSRLYVSECELNSFVREITDTFQPYINTKQITFRYETNFEFLTVWIDKQKMESILKNIISNAVKYTPDHGEILCSVSEQKNNWEVVVKDTGIGIPAKELRKLFKLHFRGTNAVNAKITGSGIGLMLVRKLVKLHNGKIKVESVENKGTLIKMTFPKGKGHYKKNFIFALPEEKMPDYRIAQSLPLTADGELPTQAGDEKLPHILVAEDNDELRAYLLQSLSQQYCVKVCPDGKKALEAVTEFWPELIISDVMMPEMRGDELCKAIKNNMETSHILILLLTALGEEKDMVQGLLTGADSYVVKPFSINILKATIVNLLGNRARLRERYARLDMDAGEPAPEPESHAESLDRKFMNAVKESIEKNLDNSDFTIDSLCSALNMSRTSFYSKLKALTGQAPADFVRNIRLQRAAQLLAAGELSVTEVAEATGFSDSKYFREVFKKYYNVSPRQYAKENHDS